MFVFKGFCLKNQIAQKAEFPLNGMTAFIKTVSIIVFDSNQKDWSSQINEQSNDPIHKKDVDDHSW